MEWNGDEWSSGCPVLPSITIDDVVGLIYPHRSYRIVFRHKLITLTHTNPEPNWNWNHKNVNTKIHQKSLFFMIPHFFGHPASQTFPRTHWCTKYEHQTAVEWLDGCLDGWPNEMGNGWCLADQFGRSSETFFIFHFYFPHSFFKKSSHWCYSCYFVSIWLHLMMTLCLLHVWSLLAHFVFGRPL